MLGSTQVARVSRLAAALLLLAPMVVLLMAEPGSARSVGVQASSARVQVLQDEWYLRPSRDRIKAGIVKIEVVNFGEDDHDLVIARKSGKRVAHFRTLAPGEQITRTVRLKRGTYKMWCALPGHKKLGMRATLIARP